MRSTPIVLAALLAANQALSADLPKEVAAFVARRNRREHFRSEDPADPALAT